MFFNDYRFYVHQILLDNDYRIDNCTIIRFGGSNPAEVDGFFQDVKILSTSPPGGTFKPWVPSLKFQAR